MRYLPVVGGGIEVGNTGGRERLKTEFSTNLMKALILSHGIL
jgi:hypothetical protein